MKEILTPDLSLAETDNGLDIANHKIGHATDTLNLESGGTEELGPQALQPTKRRHGIELSKPHIDLEESVKRAKIYGSRAVNATTRESNRQHKRSASPQALRAQKAFSDHNNALKQFRQKKKK